jgi:AraC-like DNA-binding protein
MRFVADQFAESLQNNATIPPAAAGLPLHYLAKGLAKLLETAQRELDSDREAAKASLAAASSILRSEIERSSGANGSRPGALAGWQRARVRAFIEANLHRNICVRDLSTVAQRSPAHFSRSFSRAFGEPPHAYVIKRRLERACHLMVTTSESLGEIALNVGFSDQAHFCRLFRRAFAQRPASWRRDHETRASISNAGTGEEGQSRRNTRTCARRSNQLRSSLDRILPSLRKRAGKNGEACGPSLRREGFVASVPRRPSPTKTV